jgi:two-component system NtrC family response regulator
MSTTTATTHPPLVCVVDDEASVRESVERLIRHEGFDVDSFHSAEGFLGRTRLDSPACLIIDQVLPGMSGLELHQELTRGGMDAPTILMMRCDDVSTSVRAMKAGAVDVLAKPCDEENLIAAVRRALSWRFAAQGLAARTSGIVGESQALQAVLEQVELVADTDATVLITGESGTGKELVARAIHERSHRRKGPLVTVNCAAIPESLFESELFGYVRGAFTGALNEVMFSFV